MWVLALHSWEIEGACSTSKDSAMVFKRLVAVIKSAKFFRGNSLLSLSQNLIYNIKISCNIYKTSQIGYIFPKCKVSLLWKLCISISNLFVFPLRMNKQLVRGDRKFEIKSCTKGELSNSNINQCWQTLGNIGSLKGSQIIYWERDMK